MWTAGCEAEFVQMKAMLDDERFIKAFDPNLYTELLVDTSKVAGCRYILTQRTQEGMVNIIRCGSLAAREVGRQWHRLKGNQQVLDGQSSTVLTTKSVRQCGDRSNQPLSPRCCAR